jgi:hypothetical protein
MNTKRMNRLEELGRIDNEKMNKNRRAEKKRVIGELNAKSGGKTKRKAGGKTTRRKSGGRTKK